MGMAMVRSALGRVSRRLLGSSGAPSVISRVGREILQAPLLPSLRLAPCPGAAGQVMRTCTSSAPRPHRITNLQGQQHFPVISKGIEGMKCSEQMRFLSTQRKAEDVSFMELATPAWKRIKAWCNDPRHEFMVAAFASVASILSSAITYHNIGSHHNTPSGNECNSEDQQC